MITRYQKRESKSFSNVFLPQIEHLKLANILKRKYLKMSSLDALKEIAKEIKIWIFLVTSENNLILMNDLCIDEWNEKSIIFFEIINNSSAVH